MNALELLDKGGPAMYPLLVLSLLSLATIVERIFYWIRILSKEQEIVDKVIDASSHNQWDLATQIARQERKKPIGRFLYAPLKRPQSDPDSFKLALEASAEDELAMMHKGDKLLESVITLSPLLGLLGTVLGLIRSLDGIKISDLGSSNASNITLGISESLISTAMGMIVAIGSLVFYRLFQGLAFNQMKLFRRSGNELELLYREHLIKKYRKPSEEETELMDRRKK